MARRVFVSIHRFFAITFLSLVLIGCGVGEGPEQVLDSLPPVAKQTGLLLDSAVSGVTYNTATQSGVTNALGEFEYVNGEMVTFSIGGIVLGTAQGSGILTPVELTASVNPTNQAALNLLVFLQSIDEDRDHTNGITISSAARNNAAGMNLEFKTANFATQIASIVAQITGGANPVVSEATALSNFYATYVQIGGTNSVSFLFPGFPPVGGTPTAGVPDYIFATDSSVTPNWEADVDFIYGDWGTQGGANGIFDGSFAGDTDYNPVWQAKGADGQWGSVLAMSNFTAGFASAYDILLFKVRLDGGAGTTVNIKFPGATTEEVAYDTAAVGTALGNGWYQMEIALSDFGSVSAATEFAIFTAQANTMYLTDIGFDVEAGDPEPPTPDAVDYIFATDSSVTPNWEADVDFIYGDWGTQGGANGIFDGSFAGDADYNPVWQAKGADGQWGSVLAMSNFTAGFASAYDILLFKVRLDGGAGTTVNIKFPGATTEEVAYDTAAVGTALGNGWYQMEIALSDFGSVSAATEFAIFTAQANTMYLTDIGFDVEAGDPEPPTPDAVDYIFATDSSVTPNWEADADFIYGDWGTQGGANGIFDGGFAGDADYNPVWQAKGADGQWGSVLAMSNFTAGFASAYDILLFKVRLDGGAGTTVNIKFPGATTEEVAYDTAAVGTALGNGWYQMEIALSDFGSVSAATEFAIFTAQANTMYLTDIGFSVTSGGGTGGGSQLAINGDIEDGNLDNWSVNANGGTITADDTQDSGSTWSVHVVAGPGNNPSLSLANLAVGTVMPGDIIDVSFDMCGTLEGISGAIKPALLSEFGFGAGASRQDLASIETVPSVWTRYEYSAAAESDVTGGVSLQLDVVCGAVAGCAADVYFDNVSVTIGGGYAPGDASGNSCASPVEPGVTLPIDFEDGPYVFADFDGGQASVEANSQPGGINTSANVGKMLKFAGAPWGGSTFDLGGTLSVPANSGFTMNVWSSRAVPVLFKLEGGPAAEVTATHGGGSVWEELTFDFTGIITGDHTAITFIFDNGEVGDAATDPGTWTFYFDEIDFGVATPATEPTVAAPTPTASAGDVISIFSGGAYTDVADTDFNPNWSQATVTTIESIAGNDTLKYAGLNYQGTQFGSAQDLTSAGMTHLHIDYWTADSTALNAFLIGDGETAYALPVASGNAGDIGLLKITAETGIASGVRRIEAVTGEAALAWLDANEQRLARIAELVKSSRDDADEKVAQMLEKQRGLEKELRALKGKMASSQGSDLASQAVDIKGIKVLAARLEGADTKVLRETLDQLKNKLGAAAVVLAAVDGSKISLVAGVTKKETSTVKAGELVNFVASQVGGKGGGRPDMAQAGGSQPENLDAALESVRGWVEQL